MIEDNVIFIMEKSRGICMVRERKGMDLTFSVGNFNDFPYNFNFFKVIMLRDLRKF